VDAQPTNTPSQQCAFLRQPDKEADVEMIEGFAGYPVRRSKRTGARQNQYSCMSWSQPRNPLSLLGTIPVVPCLFLFKLFISISVIWHSPSSCWRHGAPPGRTFRRCTCTQGGSSLFLVRHCQPLRSRVPASVAARNLVETRVSLIAQ
jgi:hypothetical protein